MITLLQMYVDHFYKHKDPYLIFCSSVCVKLLYNKYNMFVRDSDITFYENLPEVKLQFYKSIADKYESDYVTPDMICKSIYALELITSTF